MTKEDVKNLELACRMAKEHLIGTISLEYGSNYPVFVLQKGKGRLSFKSTGRLVDYCISCVEHSIRNRDGKKRLRQYTSAKMYVAEQRGDSHVTFVSSI